MVLQTKFDQFTMILNIFKCTLIIMVLKCVEEGERGIKYEYLKYIMYWVQANLSYRYFHLFISSIQKGFDR